MLSHQLLCQLKAPREPAVKQTTDSCRGHYFLARSYWRRVQGRVYRQVVYSRNSRPLGGRCLSRQQASSQPLPDHVQDLSACGHTDHAHHRTRQAISRGVSEQRGDTPTGIPEQAGSRLLFDDVQRGKARYKPTTNRHYSGSSVEAMIAGSPLSVKLNKVSPMSYTPSIPVLSLQQ